MARSAWFSATTHGRPVSRICVARKRFRSMFAASRTITTTSGGASPGNRARTSSRATASSGERARRLYAPGRSTTSIVPPCARIFPITRSTVVPG
jgi:hypothetical protein